MPYVRHHCPEPPCILLGLKHDLLDDKAALEKLERKKQEPITSEEAMALAEEIGAAGYIEGLSCSISFLLISSFFSFFVYWVECFEVCELCDPMRT